DLKELVQEAVAAVTPVLTENHVVLTMDLPDTVPSITADRDRLMQVLLNLLSNAVKFCDKQAGRIIVALFTTSDALRIEVTDNGPGIRREHHEIIFEKFRQVGDALTQKPGGTGLGLPISRQIVKHFGGRQCVER